MAFLPLPEPRMFKDWQQWGQLLIKALAGVAGGGATTGIPTALTTVEKASYGGASAWPTMSPGEFMVNTKNIKADSLVFVFPQTEPKGFLYEDKSQRNAGISFTIKSTDPNDTPDVAWVIFLAV